MLHRKSIRLKNYNYASPGHYFITIKTYCRQPFFGEIVDGKMALNGYGDIAKQCWLEIPEHYPSVELDEWVIMPDHIHGILRIKEYSDFANAKSAFDVGVENLQPLHQMPKPGQRHKFQHVIPGSIACIVRGFKIGVTKSIRADCPGKIIWQRNYHDHIVQDQEELNNIRNYIKLNPLKWKGND